MKNVLFISPDYFEYHLIIKNQIKKLGYNVDWVDDRPSKNILEKCILRIKPNILKRKTQKYFQKKIIDTAKQKKYDIVFVILGQSFTKEMFLSLKAIIPDSYFILYIWDSIKNFPQLEELSKAFDTVYSFDKFDCDTYNFNFLPLFYSIKDTDLNIENSSKYDVCYIGTIKKGKLSAISALTSQLNEFYQNNFFYLYLQSKLVYYFNKLFNKNEFKKYKLKDFKYKKLKYLESEELFAQSKIVVDIPMSNQNGLTMRIYECVALKKKIITSNSSVKNYDFYNPTNIYVYNPNEDIDFSNDFFSKPYEELPEEFYEKYSLDSWISSILSKNVKFSLTRSFTEK